MIYKLFSFFMGTYIIYHIKIFYVFAYDYLVANAINIVICHTSTMLMTAWLFNMNNGKWRASVNLDFNNWNGPILIIIFFFINDLNEILTIIGYKKFAKTSFICQECYIQFIPCVNYWIIHNHHQAIGPCLECSIKFLLK
jgi:hypothetical protein